MKPIICPCFGAAGQDQRTVAVVAAWVCVRVLRPVQ